MFIKAEEIMAILKDKQDAYSKEISELNEKIYHVKGSCKKHEELKDTFNKCIKAYTDLRDYLLAKWSSINACITEINLKDNELSDKFSKEVKNENIKIKKI